MAGNLDGVGAVSFSSDNTFQMTATRSVNGVIDPAPLALTGTYSVNADCTFKMTFEVGFTFSAVIVNGGNEVLFVETDPGTTLIVKAVRM